MRNLKGFVENITKPIIRKNGFVTPQIIFDWPLIVGDYLAKYTTPIKIVFPKAKNCDGTLHIEIVSAQAPIVQQLEPEIIEKIAVYFGFKAVAKIKLIHSKDLPQAEAAPKPGSLDEADSKKLDKMLDGVEDEELKKRLKSIGEQILLKKKQ